MWKWGSNKDTDIGIDCEAEKGQDISGKTNPFFQIQDDDLRMFPAWFR